MAMEKMKNGNFKEYQLQFATWEVLFKVTEFANDVQNMYLFLKGLEADIQAKVMAWEPMIMAEAIKMSCEYFRKPKPPAQVRIAVCDGSPSFGD